MNSVVAGGIRFDSWSDPFAICFKQFSGSVAISPRSRRRRCGHVPNSPRRNLFLRKQLALYQERKVKSRRADDATRIVLAGLSRFVA
jgi:hypothetical protein